MQNDKLKEAKLKPCPFCGSHAHITPAFDGKRNKYVPSCSQCFADNNGLYDTYEDAEKAWNTRPLEEKLEKIIEEAGEEIEELKERLEDADDDESYKVLKLLDKAEAEAKSTYQSLWSASIHASELEDKNKTNFFMMFCNVLNTSRLLRQQIETLRETV